METKLDLVIRDIYGGDGFLRQMPIKDVRLSRTKATTRTRSDIGVAVGSTMDETQDETRIDNVSTFDHDSQNRPVLRLGGPHGKLWGTFKSIRTNLYTLGRSDFRSKQIIEMLQVLPVIVSLEVLEPMKTVQLPQKLNTPGGAMLFPRFDMIPRAKCSVTLVYPEGIKSQVATMIEQLKFVSFLNKRRATVESLEVLA